MKREILQTNSKTKKYSTTVVIGITGGIGSGKSYVIDRISKLYKALYIHADAISKEQMLRGGCSYNKVIKTFGSDILDESMEINRKRLADIVFHDHDALLTLNKITHPAVMEEVEKKINDAIRSGKYQVVLLESALLTDAGYKRFCDEVWYVFASVSTRKERLMKNRSMKPEEIDAIISNQSTENVFKNTTDHIIINDSVTLQSELDEQISSQIEILLKDSSNSGNQ